MTTKTTVPTGMLDSNLQQRIEAIDNLPTLPEIYNQLISELSSDNVSMPRVASIVSRDVAISANLLQVVNSAFFGLKNEIQTIQQAVSYLGIDTVKGVVLTAGVYTNTNCPEVSGFSAPGLYKLGTVVGPKARFIANAFGLPRNRVDEALTAGLMHDVGKLVLLIGFADEFEQAFALSKSEDIKLHVAVEQVLGATDADIGAYLLASWGFSESIVEAVSLHYKPSTKPNPMPSPTTAVHLAYASEHDQKYRPTDSLQSAFDLAYTDILGITNDLDQFRSLTAESVMQRV